MRFNGTRIKRNEQILKRMRNLLRKLILGATI